VNRCRRGERSLSGVKTGGKTTLPGPGGGKPADGPTGVRHEGGVTLIPALVRPVGTCRPDAKGEAQAESLRKSQSTEAGHRGGAAHSRGEGAVRGRDRRGGGVRL
jgi:hypothetical protein